LKVKPLTFDKAMVRLGDTLDDEISQRLNSDRYAEIDAVILEWQKLCKEAQRGL